MTSRRLTMLVALTLLAGCLGSASAGAGTQQYTWVGQVVRDGNHYDYTGRACAVEAEICTMQIAHYRIVPVTPQARLALPLLSGGRARLRGWLAPSDDPLHNAVLRVTSASPAWASGEVRTSPDGRVRT
jgi:hypothetical protein